jgi:hypothetical protein
MAAIEVPPSEAGTPFGRVASCAQGKPDESPTQTAIECLEKGKTPSDAPPELKPLFTSAAVKEVVKFTSGGPLTKELVAECSGLSLEQPRRPRSLAPHETA